MCNLSLVTLIKKQENPSGPLEAVQQSDWSSTCCHCSKTASLLSSVSLFNGVWAGVDRAGPCVGNRSPDSGPKVSCLCFLLSWGALCECSHTTARLDICGQQIEMQVVIVIRMIDVFLLVSHKLEGGREIYCRVHMQNIYARKHTVGSLWWWGHSVRACREKKGKGVLYI